MHDNGHITKTGIQYLPYSAEYKNDFFSLVHALYTEDPGGEKITDEKIAGTIGYFLHYPENGEILIFTENKVAVGYAILLYQWSNEFGGRVIIIDELYLKNEHRNKGIGAAFLKNLSAKKEDDFKAIFLEVQPANKKAVSFYIKNGFAKTESTRFCYLF